MHRLKLAALVLAVAFVCGTFIIAVIALGLGGKAYDLANSDDSPVDSQVLTSLSANAPNGYIAIGSTTLSEWQYIAPLSFARSDHGAVTVGNGIYVIGGTGTNGEGAQPTTNANEMYSPATNTWTSKAPLQEARYRFGIAALGTKIFVMGGRVRDDYAVLASMEVYDTTTDTWTYASPLPVPRSDHVAFEISGKIYVTGGYDGDYNILNSTFAYNPSTNSWTQVAPLTVSRGDLMGVSFNGKGYVVGGWGYPDYTLLSTLEEYNPVNDTWIVKEGTLPTLAGDKGFAVINNQFMVVAGENNENGNSKPLQAVSLYNLKSGIWDTRAPLPYPALRLACAAWTNTQSLQRVYCFGGQHCLSGENTACPLYNEIPEGGDLDTAAVYTEYQLYSFLKV